jgi:hypothetical protein
MKRDKELIKQLLLLAEESESILTITQDTIPVQLEYLKATIETIVQHTAMLIDAGLIKGKLMKGGVVITAMTWEGYEFIENARNNKVWNSAKRAAGELSWEVFVNVLTEVATEFAKQIFHQEI